MLKKFSAIIMISSLLSISCATISKKDKEIINRIDTDKEVEKIVDSRDPDKKTIKKDDTIYIYQGTEKIGELTVEEFQSIIQASSYYEKILEAEKKKRVYVFFKDNPWELKPGKSVTTEMYIIWKDDKGLPLKKLALKLTLDVPKEGKAMHKARIVWRNISEIAFPVTLGVLVIVLALIFGL